LNEKYEEIGVAVVSGKIAGKETIITVQEFGTKMKNVPIRDTVAGLTTTKTASDGINSENIVWKNKNIDINAVQKNSAMFFEKAFTIPSVFFTQASLVIILLVFFTHEVMTGHMHIVLYHFSLLRKKVVISIGIVRYKSHSFTMPEGNAINFEKTYITQMKMRH